MGSNSFLNYLKAGCSLLAVSLLKNFSLIKMPHAAMSAIESRSVGNIEMAHKLRKVALRGGYQ